MIEQLFHHKMASVMNVKKHNMDLAAHNYRRFGV